MIEAVILAVQTIIVAVLGLIGRWIVVTKSQVKNDHKTNLRDDLDEFRDGMHRNHVEVMRELGEHTAKIETVRSDVDNLKAKVYTTNSLIIGKGRL